MNCGENVRVNVINEEISLFDSTDQYLPGCEHPDKLDDEEDPELELAVGPDHAGQLVPVRGLPDHADDSSLCQVSGKYQSSVEPCHKMFVWLRLF